MKVSHSSGIFGSICKLLFESQLSNLCRRFVFRVLSVGPIPNHISFIMDGNRRYAKKENLDDGSGHRAGYSTLISKLRWCYDLGVKYISVYAFSIDNFKRKPDEVQALMDLILEKMEDLAAEDGIVDEYGIRVYFIGDLKLLNETVRVSAENVMRATAKNTKCALLVCVAYTSTNEIVHAVQESCTLNSTTTCNHVIKEFCRDVYNVDDADEFVETVNGADAIETGQKMAENASIIEVVEIEKHMYMSVAPDPDLMIRTSGETRLSNFLLWQTSSCQLYSPNALWPEISPWHLLWGVITYQRNHAYLEKKKKQA